MQQGFFADEVSAGAGHVTTTMLLHNLRLVSTVHQTNVEFAVALTNSEWDLTTTVYLFVLNVVFYLLK